MFTSRGTEDCYIRNRIEMSVWLKRVSLLDSTLQ